MRYLRYNTATIVPLGIFLDKTDGVTLETALTITNERISFIVGLNNGSAPTVVLDNITGATSGTDNDLNYVATSDNATMQLELTGANTSYLGFGRITITDAANHCPVWEDVCILPQQVFDSLILGTDLLDANASQVGGTTQTGRDLGTSVLLSSGTGTGQVSLSSGAVLLQATQTGVTIPTVTTVTNQLAAATIATEVWGTATRTLTAATNITAGIATAVWGEATRTLTAATNITAGIATAVWGEATRTLTSFGTLAADVWAVATRTLTAAADSSGITTLLGRIIGTLATGTHEPQSGDSFARVGAPAGASVSADIAALPTDADVNAACDTAISDAALATAAAVADIPTVAEFNARTLVAADYTIVSDLGTVQSADHAAAIADLPTVAEFNARTAPTTAGAGAEFTAAALALGPGGGTGLTAQQTRDALKLAPTAGAAAAGSIDALIGSPAVDLAADIAAVTSPLSAGDAAQIRHKLNIDGTQTIPASEGSIDRIATTAELEQVAAADFARDLLAVNGWLASETTVSYSIAPGTAFTGGREFTLTVHRTVGFNAAWGRPVPVDDPAAPQVLGVLSALGFTADPGWTGAAYGDCLIVTSNGVGASLAGTISILTNDYRSVSQTHHIKIPAMGAGQHLGGSAFVSRSGELYENTNYKINFSYEPAAGSSDGAAVATVHLSTEQE